MGTGRPVEALIAGQAPPEMGGVAIRTLRLARILHHCGVQARVLVYRGRKPQVSHLAGNDHPVERRSPLGFLLRIFHPGASVVYDFLFPSYLFLPWYAFPVFVAVYGWRLALGTRFVVWVHGNRFPLFFNQAARWRRRILGALLRRVALVVCEEPATAEFLRAAGVTRVNLLESPVPRELVLSDGALPPGLASFLQDHSPLVVATGWAFSIIYRFDWVVNAAAALRQKFPRIGVVLVASSMESNLSIKERVLTAIRMKGMTDHVNIAYDFADLPSLLRHTDVLVRPTTSDADSSPLLEALYAGVPVLATDICQRPDGCILFSSKDDQELLPKLAAALASLERSGKQGISGPQAIAWRKVLLTPLTVEPGRET